jgi:ribonuclease HII
MPLIIAGIDEAGYGPLLGPLCIGMTAFRVERWNPGDPPPNLWTALASAVCRKPGDKKRRIAVDDSKKLKLPNSNGDAPGRHPLLHLERAVLTFLAVCPGEGVRPETDLDLFRALGAAPEPLPWYAGDPCPVPCAGISAAQIGIASNLLARAMHRAGVAPMRLACRAVCEGMFNDEVERTGTKAAATMLGVADHLRYAWEHWAPIDPAEAIEADLADNGASPPRGAGPRIVCDRQGGRTSYRGVLSRVIPGADVLELEETDRCSRYLIRAGPDDAAPAGRIMTVTFMPEAERQHLPVALASMVAKLVRELMMARFNAYWRSLIPQLKPTAGYVQDGRRWLADLEAAGVLTPQLRRTLVRRA